MRTANLAKRFLQTSAILAISVATAYAQDNEDEVDLVPEGQVAEDADTGDVITVTGSRIKRDNFSSDSPIDVLVTEDAVLEGISDVGSLIQSSTVASGSPQVTAATSSAFVQNGGVGTETVSLRGLGANRTLVLLDGRRAGPSGTRGGVSSFDLNVIPIAGVERIEILKDGASSVYGSDAVAGVVNIITRKDDGGTFDVFYSQPEQSGGETFRGSASWGRSNDKGRFRVTGDYYKNQELARGDRDFFACGQAYVTNPDGTRADIIDPTTGDFKCRDLLWGHVWVYDYGAGNVPSTSPLLYQYDYNGDLAANGLVNPAPNDPFDIGTPADWYPVLFDQNDINGLGPGAGTAGYATDGIGDWAGVNIRDLPQGLTNYDHPFQDQQTLIPDVERMTLFVNGDYAVTDTITGYAEALFNRRETYVNGYRQFWSYTYNSQAIFAGGGVGTGDPLSPGWTGLQWLSPTAITDHADTSVKVDYTRFVGGLTGGFGANFPSWSWDVSAQYSRSDGDYTNDRIYQDAIDVAFFRTSLCAGTTMADGRPCVDVNWVDPQFLAGNIGQAERDFLFGRETGNTVYEQTSFEGYISGDIVQLPAGMMAGAFGTQYIEDEILDTPGDITLANNAWGSSGAGITAGKHNTTAFYGEIDVPLLKDAPLAEKVSLTLSGRYTDVSSYGDGTTYKVGLNWQVSPSVRVRATQGTSFRSPALFELFLADQTSFIGQRSVDPCINWGPNLANGFISQQLADNCAADGIPANHNGAGSSATVFTGGGAGVLDAETADNFTVGFIWSPTFIDLQFAVDYFEIQVNDEVAQLGAANVVAGCYTSDTFPNDPLCQLFDRNAADGSEGAPFLINSISDSFININSQSNRGVDFTAQYNHELRWGDLRVDFQASHQLEDRIQLLAQGSSVDSNGRAGNPKTTALLNFNLDTPGKWKYFYGLDIIDQTSNEDRFLQVNGPNAETFQGDPVEYKLRTEMMIYHNASVSREFGNDWTFRAGVANIFDEAPPAVSGVTGQYSRVGNSAFYSQYDFLGRRAFFNLTKNFE